MVEHPGERWASGRGGVAFSNEALDLLERDGTEVDATLCFSDALSKIQTEWSLLDPQDEMGEVKTFQTMDIGGLCKLRHRGTAKVAAPCTFTCAAYNLVRLRTSLAEPSSA